VSELKAETLVPATTAEFPPIADHALGILGSIGMVIATVLHLRRRVSRDNAEITKDRVESDILERATRERDESRESERKAWSEHNKLAVECAKLRSDNEYAQREIKRLTDTVAEMQKMLDEVKVRLRHLSGGYDITD
jgi:chromosome segregation ATPase